MATMIWAAALAAGDAGVSARAKRPTCKGTSGFASDSSTPCPAATHEHSALLGWQIAALILPEAVLRPHLATAKLRVLAKSVAQRSRYMPDACARVRR